MQQVFSEKSPMLTIQGHPDEQKGMMFMSSGLMLGVRNAMTHTGQGGMPPSEQEALEWLYFASALFRMLDRAV
jgi:hypothetical protein